MSKPRPAARRTAPRAGREPAVAIAEPRATAERSLQARVRARHLALVVALADLGSLRRAAAAIALTQPAATKLLHDLEDAMGAPLFERHRWGMSPTPAGDTLVLAARGMLNDLAHAHADIAARGRGAVGSLRIGAVTGAVPRFLAPAIVALQARASGAPRLRAGQLERGAGRRAASRRPRGRHRAASARRPARRHRGRPARPRAARRRRARRPPAGPRPAHRPRDARRRDLDRAAVREPAAARLRRVPCGGGTAAAGRPDRDGVDRRDAGDPAGERSAVADRGRPRAALRAARRDRASRGRAARAPARATR